jgi:hypothetical protein
MREAFMATSYLDALTAEIRILIRTIATDPTKRLSAVKVRWLDAQGNRVKEYVTNA